LTSTTSPAAADDVDVDDTIFVVLVQQMWLGEINKILDSMRELEPRKSQLIVAAQF